MLSTTAANSKVRLTDLKRFALEKLLEGPLRDDILSQPEVAPEDYLANCSVWLRLTRLRRD